jgi:hypothetical protein
VGREFVLAYPAGERSPTRRPRATRDGPPEGGDQSGRPPGAKRSPGVHWETMGPSARPLGYPTNFPG